MASQHKVSRKTADSGASDVLELTSPARQNERQIDINPCVCNESRDQFTNVSLTRVLSPVTGLLGDMNMPKM